jgi:predicted ester cyclase
MNITTNRLSQISSFTSLINQHDTHTLASYFTPDVSITRGDGITHIGVDVVEELFRALITAFADLRLLLTRTQSLDKDAVIAEWTLIGTQLGAFKVGDRMIADATASRTIKSVFAALLTFNDSDVIKQVVVHGDTSGLLAELPPLLPVKVDPDRIHTLAERQTAAWDNHDAVTLSNNYSETGWIIINGGTPWAGRAGLVTMASSYMEAFPDLGMTMVDIHIAGDRAVWSWHLTGTNTGSGGTGQTVSFSGYEVWQIDNDGLIAESYGYYDSVAYMKQVEHGV